MPPGSRRWWVVVPVRDTRRGKTRVAVAPGPRTRLARALALDTVGAALATAGVRGVLAVTTTAADADLLAASGARPVRQRGAGLSDAVATGLRAVPAGAAAAVLLGDLPAAEPADLAVVLGAVRPGGAVFVADAAGTGTTLVALDGARVRLRFGPWSSATHRAAGLTEAGALVRVAPGLRHDVDTLADLEQVRPLLARGSRVRAVLGTEALLT